MRDGEITILPYNKANIKLARSLRKNMTPHERKLWYAFLAACDVRFQRQKVIGNYIADFYCASKKLVIELDGGQHYDDDHIEYDKQRDAYFNSVGIRVLRYTNREVDCNFKDVCNDILKNITTTPQSSINDDSSPHKGSQG